MRADWGGGQVEPEDEGGRDEQVAEQPTRADTHIEAQGPDADHRSGFPVAGPAIQRATTHVTTPSTPATIPRPAAISCQKAYGYSWTSRSVRGSNAQLPPGKKIRWNSSKRGSNATNPTTPMTTTPIDGHDTAQTDRTHDPVGSVAPDQRDRDTQDGDRTGTEEQPQQRSRVVQVVDLRGVIERDARWHLERECARPEEQLPDGPVGQGPGRLRVAAQPCRRLRGIEHGVHHERGQQW